jgi:hypothetical protein
LAARIDVFEPESNHRPFPVYESRTVDDSYRELVLGDVVWRIRRSG